MKNNEIKDLVFREAVEAIDTGNITLLQNLLIKHPELVRTTLDRPSGDYFENPYLLWFVADNPIRNYTLPANIVDITRLIISFVKQNAPGSMQHQLDYALGLVATGRTPRECRVQSDMIDLLIDEGAKPDNGLGALANGNVAAAERLIERGGLLTLATAGGLGLMDDVMRLMQYAGTDEKLTALAVAAFYGNTEMLAVLLNTGVNPDGYPAGNTGFHSHATPLHQAVSAGSLESVTLLVEAGANLDAKDKVYSGTPRHWAQYLYRDGDNDEAAKQRFAAIEAYLQEIEKNK